MHRNAVGLAGAGAVAGMVAAVTAVHGLDGTAASPITPPGSREALWIGGLALASASYVVGLLLLRRRTAALVAVGAVAAAIQLAPLAAPLLLSRDAYLYWDYGRISAVHHGNPYRDFPGRWPDDPAYRQTSSAWARLLSPYGPAWTGVDAAGARIVGTSPRDATRFFRWLAAAGAVVLVAAVARGTRSAFSTALVGWNPLLALHFAGGGHADAWMMALVAVALALAARRPAASGVAWVASVFVKVTPLAFLPLELVWRHRTRQRLPLVGLVGAGVAAVAVSTAVFGLGWLHAAAPISNQLREANSLGLPARLHQAGLPLRPAQAACALLFVAGYAWLLWEAWRGCRRLALAAIFLCLGIGWLMPWYASWPLALAAFDLDAVGIVLAVALSGYVLLDAVPL